MFSILLADMDPKEVLCVILQTICYIIVALRCNAPVNSMYLIICIDFVFYITLYNDPVNSSKPKTDLPVHEAVFFNHVFYM